MTVSGTIADGLSGIDPATAAYCVADDYGLVQPSGSMTVGADGSYSFTVPLEARRNGNDKAGRHYTITVSASDRAGNAAHAQTVVIVPHDQGKSK